MNLKKRILVAPLNWGIGHATRCIPIINALIANDFEPIIASDGAALLVLQKEFPNIKTIKLAGYDIRYPKQGKYLKLKLLKSAPKIFKSIRLEHQQICTIVSQYSISGIISDNRFGVYHSSVPSVFITHQLHVLSGTTTWFSSRINTHMMRHFDTCWVPDVKGNLSLSGRLSALTHYPLPTQHIGLLSRLKQEISQKEFDLMVLLSGPEPQRTLLEEELLNTLKHYKKKAVFIRGIIEDKQVKEVKNNLTIINYMQTEELLTTLNKSDLVICRSGYSTIMDLAKLQKRAFFIPTPGQFEQEYLAAYLNEKRIVPYCKQGHFTIDKLISVKEYTGFTYTYSEPDFKDLFRLF